MSAATPRMDRVWITGCEKPITFEFAHNLLDEGRRLEQDLALVRIELAKAKKQCRLNHALATKRGRY